jgi:hypothetical protein
VKTLQAGEDIWVASVVLICKVWKSTIMLFLFVVKTCKRSINPIIQNPVYSHSILCDIILKHTFPKIRVKILRWQPVKLIFLKLRKFYFIRNCWTLYQACLFFSSSTVTWFKKILSTCILVCLVFDFISPHFAINNTMQVKF